ncbi:DUF6456 domain-containing protein [Caulobacter sp. NIBR2454]|uniref:DUF6456 domain-containing protein n=1 Tax=Caulobacter sp. NIBR2454 TaxID=3015996 RepID=UPI0022B5E68C|nr:DUF6456 domain-containing protein [Caulobacter sp. NIBR2454]
MNRAAALLARPGAWLEASGGVYLLRATADRRRRPMMWLDEAAFDALVREPGLRPRGEGGYVLARTAVAQPAPSAAARPGFIEGERTTAEPDGRLVARRANLGESPIAWLARRRDPQGRPWLTPIQAAAGEKLREDFHRAGTLGRLTMAWDAGPRGSGGRGPGLEPAERARAAKDRIARALDAVGPGLKEMLERVCGAGSALDAAERALGLPRRSGKTVLTLALDRLAQHYGLA